MSLSKIIASYQDFLEVTAYLSANSPYYPETIKLEAGRTIYYSTRVRIERDGKWYAIHCVESFMPTATVDEANCLHRLMLSAHQIQHLYQITGHPKLSEAEKVDDLQITETERLIEDEKRRFPHLHQ